MRGHGPGGPRVLRFRGRQHDSGEAGTEGRFRAGTGAGWAATRTADRGHEVGGAGRASRGELSSAASGDGGRPHGGASATQEEGVFGSAEGPCRSGRGSKDAEGGGSGRPWAAGERRELSAVGLAKWERQSQEDRHSSTRPKT